MDDKPYSAYSLTALHVNYSFHEDMKNIKQGGMLGGEKGMKLLCIFSFFYHRHTPFCLGKVIYCKNYNRIGKVYVYCKNMAKGYFFLTKQEFDEVNSCTKGAAEMNVIAAPSALNHIQPKARRLERISKQRQGTARPRSE